MRKTILDWGRENRKGESDKDQFSKDLETKDCRHKKYNTDTVGFEFLS